MSEIVESPRENVESLGNNGKFRRGRAFRIFEAPFENLIEHFELRSDLTPVKRLLEIAEIDQKTLLGVGQKPLLEEREVRTERNHDHGEDVE